ncbi:hypothetical protein V2G26_012960 [Clonostachys chloroleuca]
MTTLVRAEEEGIIASPLPQVVGYVLVVVVGLLFAFVMIGITALLKRTQGEDNSKIETFMVADRKVGTGLVASAVVSSWLWSTALLSCVLVTYSYGVSGAFWYGAGCSPMIAAFAYLGIICKKRIPEAHTVLEVIRLRYGTLAHVSFGFLAVVNNLFNTINMILGASSVISFLTGMHIMSSTFLVPVGVVLYTLFGGIKATFLTDYIHTTIIVILCLYLTIKTFQHESVGSIGGLYDLVVAAQDEHKIAGNYQESILTMTSKEGINFAIILLVSNFGCVIMDTGYFIKAFAASPSSVVPGYIAGSISYFSIPWCLGTILGLVAIGLEGSSSFPTYPRAMTSEEVTTGLVLPYAAMAVAGTGGAVAVLLMTFMAITSTLSAQVIAVSSIFSFDFYRTYVNTEARSSDLIRWSRFGVVLFGIVSAGLTAACHYGGIDMAWTLYTIGIVVCPGTFPTVFAILWRRQSRVAAIGSSYLGIITGIAVWLGTAYRFGGEISIATTGLTLPCMYGTVASMFSPLLFTIIISYFWPAQDDWETLEEHKLAVTDNSESGGVSANEAEEAPKNAGPSKHDSSISVVDKADADVQQRRWTRQAMIWAIATFLGHWVLWPLPIYAANYIFSKTFFTAWVVVSIIWLWASSITVSVWPLWSGREQLIGVYRALFKSGSSSST